MRKLILLNIIIFLVCGTSMLNAQEVQKDTLFFKLDGKYAFESKYTSNSYLLKDSNDIGRGTFFFEKLEDGVNEFNPKEILCLKKYVRSTTYYNKHKKIKLNDYRLFEHFEDYIIYLVKKNKSNVEYIHVRANFEIE